MDRGKFLEPESMYPIIPWRFPIWYFLLLFWVNLNVFSLSIFLWVLLTLLTCCFIHSAFFCYVLLVAIFYSKIVRLPLHLVVGMSTCQLPRLVSRIFFRCFEMFSLVCIVLPFLDIFLILLLSPVLSGLFLWVVLSFFTCVAVFFVS